MDVITVTLFLLAILGFFLLTKEHPESAVLFAIPLFIFPLPYYFTLAVARFQYVIDPILVVLAAHRIAIWVGGRARQLETVADEKRPVYRRSFLDFSNC